MSYRSIKKVLGETSLERKIRFLFGFCLLILIGGSFLWVTWITEGIVAESTRSKAHELIAVQLFKLHMNSDLLGGSSQAADAEVNREFRDHFGNSIRRNEYRVEFLTLNRGSEFEKFKTTRVATDPEDRKILEKLKTQFNNYRDKKYDKQEPLSQPQPTEKKRQRSVHVWHLRSQFV